MGTYRFDNFDYTDGYITLPKNIVFYRGVPSEVKDNDIIRDVPIYLAPEKIAAVYGKKVCKITTDQSIRLLDIRKLQCILQVVLDNVREKTPQTMAMLTQLTLSFGLCSYRDQVSLMESWFNRADFSKAMEDKIDYMKRFDMSKTQCNPLIPRGVRIGETTTDGRVMLVLRELLKDVCDGYIAPKLHSPFHINNIAHEEIVLFDPIKLDLRIDKTDGPVSESHISERILISNSPVVVSSGFASTKICFAKTGGSRYEDKNTFYDDTKQTTLEKKRARRFVKNLCLDIRSLVPDVKPHPTYYV